jgi:F-type H+-transporting ATPase subunit b
MFASEAAEGGGTGPFSINPGLTLWTLIVFGLFLFFFRKTFWYTIVSRAEEREKKIAQQLADAERANTEARTLLEEQRRLTAEARGAAQTILAEARAAAEKERAAAVEKTKHEQDTLLERARQELQSERDKAIVELRRQAVDLALGAASKVIGQRLDAEADRKIVLEYVSQLEKAH